MKPSSVPEASDLGPLSLEQAFQRYVHSPTMPCPYARLPVSYLHLQDPIDSEATRQLLREGVTEFWDDQTKSILLLVPHDEPSSHEEARQQSYWVRHQWHYLHLLAKDPAVQHDSELSDKLKRHYLMLMRDPDSFLGPRVVIGGVDVMMTAFNPLYDPVHPRYAPQAVLVVIRSDDLLARHSKNPEISRKIATQAKCMMLLSMLRDRSGLEVDLMCGEYPLWLEALRYYSELVMTVYTDSYRIDPGTLPHLAANRRTLQECLASQQFQGSLVAFRAIIANNPDVPVLNRVLAQNPAISVFDVAKIVYGDVSGMYVLP